jgi:hypothetical protein
MDPGPPKRQARSQVSKVLVHGTWQRKRTEETGKASGLKQSRD